MRRMIAYQRAGRLFGVLAVTLAVSGMLTGCVVVGASSSGGWFVWPGGLGLIFMIILLVILLRRRR